MLCHVRLAVASVAVGRCAAPALLLASCSPWHCVTRPYTRNTTDTAGQAPPDSTTSSISSSSGSNTSTRSSNSSTPGSDASQQQQQREGAYRRGFGAKVALPSTDVLHEVLVGHPATIKFRAYNIGARIHIGQVLALAQREGCRTNSGKDYCIIWLKSAQQRLLDSSSSSSSSTVASPYPTSGLLFDTIKGLEIFKKYLAQAHSVDTKGMPQPQLLQQLLQQVQQAQQQQQRQVPQAQQQQQRQQQPRQQQQGWQQVQQHSVDLRAGWGATNNRMMEQSVPQLLVVYRYGSVVFAGTRADEEPGLVDEYVPSGVRYKAGGDSTWAVKDPMRQSRHPSEEHTVVINPRADAHAAKGTDQVLLRVLDVGAVRVLTSVLAQSAALNFYEMSVHEALHRLSHWRARTRRSAQADRVALLSGQQEQTLFKVIAASALVISEARELLEMAEPAWDYAAYHTIWALTSAEFELESRFKALEMKLRQVEREAKHDVKDRAGRSYHRLEWIVVWLLVASCALAGLRAGKKAYSKHYGNAAAGAATGDGCMMLLQESDPGSGSSSEGASLSEEAALAAAAAAFSSDEAAAAAAAGGQCDGGAGGDGYVGAADAGSNGDASAAAIGEAVSGGGQELLVGYGQQGSSRADDPIGGNSRHSSTRSSSTCSTDSPRRWWQLWGRSRE